MILLYIRKY